jgi:hypothetical protein
MLLRHFRVGISAAEARRSVYGSQSSWINVLLPVRCKGRFIGNRVILLEVVYERI